VNELTKSDFILGLECPFKLRYRKLRYPDKSRNDPMREFLARGGFMIEALAHAVLSVDDNVEFEKTLTAGRLSARIDAFLDDGSNAKLIEVKSTTVTSDDPSQFLTKDGSVKADYARYINDIAFQMLVARSAVPRRSLSAHLCCVNKTKTSTVASIFDRIELVERERGSGLDTPRAIYQGDTETLRSSHFLEVIDVTAIVNSRLPSIEEEATWLLDFLDGKHPEARPHRSVQPCKACEYRGSGLSPSGFTECWGVDGSEPMAIDLHYLGGTTSLIDQVDALRDGGKVLLRDLDVNIEQAGGVRAQARRRQIEAAQTDREIFVPSEAGALSECVFPLFFLDIETSAIPVPYSPGSRPYEQTVFQLSCHAIKTPDAVSLEHHEWLNLSAPYPNREFVHELRSLIGDHGSILTWSPYERTALREVRRQLEERGDMDDELADWVDAVAGLRGDGSSLGRIVDLSVVSRAAYAHPAMNGSHSVKKVLDGVWSSASHLWSHPWFAKYYLPGPDGSAIDPYEVLTINGATSGIELDSAADENVAVTNGVAAMEAYQELMFGPRRGDDAYAAKLRRALLAYCELDTAAMVMIWMHWHHLMSES